MGSKSDPNNGKMRDLGYSGPQNGSISDPGSGSGPDQKWSKMGPKWVILGYFEVLLSLLKRFDSLLRARAKVYSRYYLTSPRARIDPSGVYLDPPRRLSL